MDIDEIKQVRIQKPGKKKTAPFFPESVRVQDAIEIIGYIPCHGREADFDDSQGGNR